MSGIEKVCEFLRECEVYYLATVEGDQPRVRPFGTALIYEGRLYIQTSKEKEVSKQIGKNPKVEISCCKNDKWLRVAGELENDDRIEVKESMLDAHPNLKGMYKADDPNMQVLYFKNGTATFYSYSGDVEVIEIQ